MLCRKYFNTIWLTTMIACLVVSIFLYPYVNAEQTVKSIEIGIGYVPISSADQIYNRTITINPPDGIAEILNLEIMLKGDFQASTNIKVGIRKKGNIYYCEPDTWTTPNINTSDYRTYFDCTSLARQYNYRGGDIEIGLITNKVSINIKSSIMITYYNKPKSRLEVHGTEYQVGDIGKIFLQLISDNEVPIQNASCFSSIYYPNCSIFINNTLMVYAVDGLYGTCFSIPNTVGVYMISSICYLPSLVNRTVYDDMESGDASGGSGWEDDWQLSSADCYFDDGFRRQQRGLWFLTCKTPSEYAYRKFNSTTNDSAYLTFWAKGYSLEAGDYCYWDYYNGTDYITLLSITDGEDTLELNYYAYEVSQYGTSANSSLRMRTGASNGASDYCHLDDVNISMTNEILGDYEYEVVRGGGELHVSDYASTLYGAVESVNNTIKETNQTLFERIQYSISIMSATNQSLYDFLTYVNQSTMNKLYGIQGELADIYILALQTNYTTTEIRTRIEEINESTTNYLYGMKSDLADILNDISDVYDLIGEVNISIENRLDQISTGIDDLGTQIDNVNISIHNKIDQFTTDLANQLANITNVTLNITADLEEVANDVWTLFFKRGTPPLAPSTAYYCDPTDSDILVKNITYQFIDDKGKVDYFSKIENIPCAYGCINGTLFSTQAYCDYDPSTKYGIALIIIIGMMVFLYLLFRSKS